MVEPLLDLERIAGGVRWRRGIWIFTALLGLLGGMALAILLPPPPTAVARVLIFREEDGSAERTVLMENDVALFQTTQVASEALKKLNVDEPVVVFLDQFKGVGLTANVLEITATAKTDSDAVRRVDALATTFIDDHVRRAHETDDAKAKALTDQRSALAGTVDQVNASIASGGAQGAVLDALYTRRADLQAQMQDLDKRAADAHLGATSVIAGTQIVDPPHVLPSSLLKTTAMNALLGLVLGLGVGIAVAAVLTITRDRPVLRRDIAAHLGASVIAQIPGRRRLWHSRERNRVAATLARLVRDAGHPVSLLEVGCGAVTSALALDIAQELGPEKVALIDGLQAERLSEKVGKEDSSVQVVDVTELPLDRPALDAEPLLLLGVGSANPGTSWLNLDRLGAETVLVVRTGHASTLWLHTVARQVAEAGIAVIGVVLVAPDPRDRSDGTLWDGLHLALQQRPASGAGPAAAGQPTLPPPEGNGGPPLPSGPTHDVDSPTVGIPRPSPAGDGGQPTVAIPRPIPRAVPNPTASEGHPAPADRSAPVLPALGPARPKPTADGAPARAAPPRISSGPVWSPTGTSPPGVGKPPTPTPSPGGGARVAGRPRPAPAADGGPPTVAIPRPTPRGALPGAGSRGPSAPGNARSPGAGPRPSPTSNGNGTGKGNGNGNAQAHGEGQGNASSGTGKAGTQRPSPPGEVEIT